MFDHKDQLSATSCNDKINTTITRSPASADKEPIIQHCRDGGFVPLKHTVYRESPKFPHLESDVEILAILCTQNVLMAHRTMVQEVESVAGLKESCSLSCSDTFDVGCII